MLGEAGYLGLCSQPLPNLELLQGTARYACAEVCFLLGLRK